MIKRKIFGLDISDHSIEALVLAKPFFGKPKITAYSRLILRGEIVKNGVIKKPDKLAENITKLLKSAQPKAITTPYCILSLPESQVFTTVFKLPAGLKRNEIRNSIPYKAEEVIPFKSAEIYFDFKTITSQDATQEVFYVAVPTKIVDSYVAVLENLGLKPLAFDLESISLARALLGLTKKSAPAKLLMDVGSRTTNLNIFDRNGIRQSLAISIAGNRFTKAIAANLKITAKEADELKMKNGFDPKKQQGKVLLVLQNEFKRIIAETKQLIDYYQGQNQKPIDHIFLVGGSALLPAIDQYLADNLGIEATVGNPLAQIADSKSSTKLKGKAVLFANVIGLAWRGLAKDPGSEDINLLPVSAKKFDLAPPKAEKKAWRLIYLRLFILIILLLVLFAVFILRQRDYDIYQKFFPNAKEYETIVDPSLDLELLEELRTHFLVPTTTATTTPTSTEALAPSENKIRIKATSLGYLNVRSGPGTGYDKVTEVSAGEEYLVLTEDGDWYQIQLTADLAGWVYSVYVDKLE